MGGDDHRQNGIMKASLLKIESSVEEIKQDLTLAVQDLTKASKDISLALSEVSTELHNVAANFESVKEMWGKSIPIKLVFLLFALVFFIVAGLEAVEWLFKVYLKGLI